MKIRFEAVALLLIVVFLGVMIAFSHREDLNAEQLGGLHVVRSSYRTLPEGLKALYLTLDRLGYQPRRLTQSYAALPERGLLIVADPYKRPVGDFDMRTLLQWVRAGNHALLLVEYHPDKLLPVPDLAPEVGYEDVFGGETGQGGNAQAQQASDIARGRTMTEATPLAPSFLSARAPALAVKTRLRLPSDRALPITFENDPVGLALLYGDAHGASVAYAPFGKGGIIWCTSPWSFSNEGLKARDGQNLDLILALADLQPGAPVLFDEYHHEFGAKMSLWTLMPRLTKLGVLELTAAFLLLLISLVWRFGPEQLPLDERFSRSRAEYLTSMASLFERHRLTHVVLQRLRLRLARQLGLRLGLPANAPLAGIVQANVRRPLVNPAQLERISAVLEHLESQVAPDESQVLALARQVERLVAVNAAKGT